MLAGRRALSLARRRTASLGCAALLGVTTSAQADVAFAEDRSPAGAAASSPKRPIPDYDGRNGVETSPDDGAGTWTGRVLLAPLYVTSEYVLRRPLGALTVAAERADVPRKLYDFFAFGPDHKIGFVPVGFVEFGFAPSFGVYAFWDDALLAHNHVRLHTEMWPTDWFATKVSDRYEPDDAHAFEIRFATVTRPDNAFYGIGPRTLQSAESRYRKTGFDASATEEENVWRSSFVHATLGLRKVDLSPGAWGGDPSLEQAARAGRFSIPFGFNRGYIEPYTRIEAALDTRGRAATSGSSVGLRADSEQGGDVQHRPASGWIRYGVAAHATLDLNDHGRLLTLRVGALFADPLGSTPTPFTELVSLGGEKWMYGYFDGRLVDRSALVGSLEYSWPVAPWVNGLLQVATGDVFGQHLEGFRPDLLRLSGAVGLAVGTGIPIQLLVGAGSETFAHGAQLDSFRFSIGVPRSL